MQAIVNNSTPRQIVENKLKYEMNYFPQEAQEYEYIFLTMNLRNIHGPKIIFV